MASNAHELPLHLASLKPDLDPYGQMLRMLMPRALGVGIYDARGAPLWVADGYDGPDPLPLVQAALTRVPPATTGRIDGFSQDHEGAPAYVFRLRNSEGDVIAITALLTRDGESRHFSFVPMTTRRKTAPARRPSTSWTCGRSASTGRRRPTRSSPSSLPSTSATTT